MHSKTNGGGTVKNIKSLVLGREGEKNIEEKEQFKADNLSKLTTKEPQLYELSSSLQFLKWYDHISVLIFPVFSLIVYINFKCKHEISYPSSH